ncbi:molybdenum cofactor guanylyltransferase MobA [Paraburkholderia phymatum]|uniref:Molybdenum cofactor guanylyltransferase n=1 Tax=Paraburkholderia phymatum (strain DSM 17167 / CIP 108236 / LMG 21445 / STM815) TaxID=391038 RepID=B2JFH7_PARP8|nr:molybdenum cofactor guanylyltransferase MobA [Paraburkholderia phymatum]ACC70005.1 molybdopterin-guanine dinucleotide biosynthesis protein A [Paraburkholderia phymatum STM815]
MTVTRDDITGLLLAGGRGMRMGGADKGLQTLHGEPLALHVMRRLAPQAASLLISANRHRERYAELGAPFHATVIADTLPDFPGPLAGLLAGLRAASTPFVLSAPCDTPSLPADLAERLASALDAHKSNIATVTTRDADGNLSIHPVFALVRTSLADDLEGFLQAGERKVRTWYARHTAVEVAFPDERTFYNINSLQELADFERR